MAPIGKEIYFNIGAAKKFNIGRYCCEFPENVGHAHHVASRRHYGDFYLSSRIRLGAWPQYAQGRLQPGQDSVLFSKRLHEDDWICEFIRVYQTNMHLLTVYDLPVHS